MYKNICDIVLLEAVCYEEILWWNKYGAIMLVCLTGCGKGNTLKCTGKVDGNEATATATLNGDKITKVVMETKSVADSEDEAKQGVAMINGLSSLAGEGMTMSAKANGKNVTMTITMDVAKVSEDNLESNLGTTDLSKDSFVKAMEDEGLTCK